MSVPLKSGRLAAMGFSRSVLKRSLHHLYHIVTNFPEICAFIIGFMWTKKSAKNLRKQVIECLQNLYQSIGIHMTYLLLVLLLRLPKYYLQNYLTTPPNNPLPRYLIICKTL